MTYLAITDVDQMEEALFFKFTQHPQLRDELLGTGDAELIEVRNLFSLHCYIQRFSGL